MHRGILEPRDQPQWDLRAVNGQVKGQIERGLTYKPLFNFKHKKRGGETHIPIYNIHILAYYYNILLFCSSVSA